jgi:hypothetical protein
MGSPPDLVLACNVVAPNPQGALPDGLFQLVSVNQGVQVFRPTKTGCSSTGPILNTRTPEHLNT